MPRRPSTTDPELLAHQQWLGYLQPVGLVVAPAAMQDAGWVVARSGSELIERQQRYRDALEPLGGDDDDANERELGFTGIETLLVEQLGWGTDQVQSDPKLIEDYTRELPELGETLQPTAVVPVASGEGAQLLVQELPLLTPLDQKLTAGEHHRRNALSGCCAKRGWKRACCLTAPSCGWWWHRRGKAPAISPSRWQIWRR